jgi:hypothetical protein
MKNHGTGHVADRLNHTFRDSILMMGICPTVTNELMRLTDVLNELVCLESTAVSKVVLNNNTTVKAKLFIVLFSADFFYRGEPELVFNVNICGGVIHKETSVNILVRSGLVVGVKGTSMKSLFEMVHRDTSPRTKMACLETTITLRDLGLSFRLSRTTLGLGKFTDRALRCIGLDGRSESLGNERNVAKDMLQRIRIQMAKLVMPFEQEFLACSKILIFFVDNCEIHRGLNFRTTVCISNRKAAARIV